MKPPPSSSHSKVEPPCVEENVKRRAGRFRRVVGRRADGRVRRGRVHRPRELRGRGVGVAGDVGRAHLEGVAAFGEARVALRAGAAGEAAAVELALEGGAGLGRGEREGRAGRVGRVVRRRADGGVRRGLVDLDDVRGGVDGFVRDVVGDAVAVLRAGVSRDGVGARDGRPAAGEDRARAVGERRGAALEHAGRGIDAGECVGAVRGRDRDLAVGVVAVRVRDRAAGGRRVVGGDVEGARRRVARVVEGGDGLRPREVVERVDRLERGDRVVDAAREADLVDPGERVVRGRGDGNVPVWPLFT